MLGWLRCLEKQSPVAKGSTSAIKTRIRFAINGSPDGDCNHINTNHKQTTWDGHRLHLNYDLKTPARGNCCQSFPPCVILVNLVKFRELLRGKKWRIRQDTAVDKRKLIQSSVKDLSDFQFKENWFNFWPPWPPSIHLTIHLPSTVSGRVSGDISEHCVFSFCTTEVVVFLVAI